jgi:hypothetical protein
MPYPSERGTPTTLHIVFSDSAIGLLRRALVKLGRDDAIVSLPDNYAIGPIDPPDPAVRATWLEHHLGESTDLDPESASAAWQVALSASGRRVVWMSRRTTIEYAGFLEWVSRAGDGAYDVADLTDHEIEVQDRQGRMQRRRAVSLSLLNPDATAIQSFIDDARPLSERQRSTYQEAWQNLRTENAPLRVLRNNELVSAPITFFDDLLLSFASDRWRKTAMLIAQALVASWDDDCMQVGDGLLGARVRALAKARQLDSQGDLSDWHHSEVKLPAR